MTYELKSIKQILDEVKTVSKGKYRKLFEKKKETKKSNELEAIVNGHLPLITGKVYRNGINSSDSGERFGIATINISVDEYGGAHGLTYKSAYQIVDLKRKKIIDKFGPATYRGGHASDMDNWAIYFTQSKVLEEKDDKVVIGLKSSEELTIREYEKDGNFKELENYDLEQEAEEEIKVKSVKKAIKELDTRSIKDFLNASYNYGPGGCTVNKVSDDLVFAYITNLDRSYDGKVDSVDTYLIVKDKGIVKLGEVYLNTYHPEPKYTVVYPRIKDFKFEKSGEKVKLSGIIEAEGKTDTGFGRQSRGVQDTKEFEYKIDLAKLKD